MIEYTFTETGRIESLAGYSWQEIKQNMSVYARPFGYVDPCALAYPTEQASATASILETMLAVEDSVKFYELAQALGFLYAKYDFQVYYYEYGLAHGSFQPNRLYSGFNEAHTLLLTKLVPQKYELAAENIIYTRLRELRKKCSSDKVVEMSIYTHALSMMQEGRKKPRRKKRASSRIVLHACYQHLDKLINRVSVQALESIESRKRLAWFQVLACCFPGVFCKHMTYSQKTA